MASGQYIQTEEVRRLLLDAPVGFEYSGEDELAP